MLCHIAAALNPRSGFLDVSQPFLFVEELPFGASMVISQDLNNLVGVGEYPEIVVFPSGVNMDSPYTDVRQPLRSGDARQTGFVPVLVVNVLPSVSQP